MTKDNISPENNQHDYFILFEVGDTTYGVLALMVQQMEMLERITPVPNAAEFVEGVVFSRGQVIPAISMRALFGLEKIPINQRTRLLVIKTEAATETRLGKEATKRIVGLIADTAREFVSIPLDAIQKPTAGWLSATNYLTGIVRLGERTILILNVDELLKN